MPGNDGWPIGRRCFVSLAAASLSAPAAAQKSDDTLRISWRDAIPNLDPYHNALRAGLVVTDQSFDGLVFRDPETLAIKPLLASAWRYIDATTLEFDLRHDVKFHDGSPFTADDVVYTVNTVLTEPLAVPSNYQWLAGADKLDDYKVRIRLKRVFPASLQYIALVTPILPKVYRESVGPDGFAKAPIGCGPYSFREADGSSRIVLVRFDGYYAGSPKGKPAIRRLIVRIVKDAATEVADLLNGRADWIWNFAADQFDIIDKVPNLQALQAESMRIGYLGMDAAGRSGPEDPFTRTKVRQAVCYAIDRQAMVKNLMPPGSRVLEAPCYPTQFGCDASHAVRYEYNPTKAKQLLDAAGYSAGFDTEIVSYVLPQISDAIHGYLRVVGINARVTTLQVAAALGRELDGSCPIALGTYGSYSINDVSAILPYFFGGGGNDYAHDPEVEKRVEAGGASINPDERRKDYIEAIHLITEEAYWLPLATYVTTYGFSRDLNFKPYPDEIPRFYLASWK